jgi:hypothetical protein
LDLETVNRTSTTNRTDHEVAFLLLAAVTAHGARLSATFRLVEIESCGCAFERWCKVESASNHFAMDHDA